MTDPAVKARADLKEVIGRARAPRELRDRIIEDALAQTRSRQRRRPLATVALVACAVSASLLLVVLWAPRERPAPPSEREPARLTSRSPSMHPARGGAARAGPDAGVPSHREPARRLWSTTVKPMTVPVGPHRARLAPGSRMRLVRREAHGAELVVSKGQVGFAVRPLDGQATFRVRTRQVLVDVVGTRFEVEARDRCTRVEVERGLVRVTASSTGEVHRLGPGARRTFCARPSAPEVLSREERMARRALSLLEERDLAGADVALARYLERYPAGMYAEEALFQLVLVRRRRGLHDQADLMTASFLERFPGSRHAERLRRLMNERNRPR